MRFFPTTLSSTTFLSRTAYIPSCLTQSGSPAPRLAHAATLQWRLLLSLHLSKLSPPPQDPVTVSLVPDLQLLGFPQGYVPGQPHFPPLQPPSPHDSPTGRCVSFVLFSPYSWGPIHNPAFSVCPSSQLARSYSNPFFPPPPPVPPQPPTFPLRLIRA